MMRRARFLAGVLGLAAVALSHAEALLASKCAPGMDMSVASEDSEAMDPSMDMGGMSMPDRDTDDDGKAPFNACPLGPALGQGCLAVASLPGVAPRAAVAPADHVGSRSVDVARPDLLLAHGLFRPPRA